MALDQDNSELRTQDSSLEEDPFDRLYVRWADHAMRKRLDPPSRERWDEIVLRLISSEDPERVRLYRRIEAAGDDTLGGDAYALWSKMPDFYTNRTVSVRTWPQFLEYAKEQRGSMRRLMEAKGLGEKYNAIVAAQSPSRKKSRFDPENPGDKPRVRRSQTSVVVIGCAGIAAMLIMALTVLLIVILRVSG